MGKYMEYRLKVEVDSTVSLSGVKTSRQGLFKMTMVNSNVLSIMFVMLDSMNVVISVWGVQIDSSYIEREAVKVLFVKALEAGAKRIYMVVNNCKEDLVGSNEFSDVFNRVKTTANNLGIEVVELLIVPGKIS